MTPAYLAPLSVPNGDRRCKQAQRVADGPGGRRQTRLFAEKVRTINAGQSAQFMTAVLIPGDFWARWQARNRLPLPVQRRGAQTGTRGRPGLLPDIMAGIIGSLALPAWPPRHLVASAHVH